MMIFKIRKALEASVKRKFKADVTDAGTMLDGTEADFAFELNDRRYDVQIKDTTEEEKKPEDITQKEWVKGHKKWKGKAVTDYELGLPPTDEPTPIREDE